ncbi:MAG: hypothetical protein VXU46_04225, partial [Planctomycetota bacterium]|nr:hypothetical protein [Planctomycetota bacterium]
FVVFDFSRTPPSSSHGYQHKKFPSENEIFWKIINVVVFKIPTLNTSEHGSPRETMGLPMKRSQPNGQKTRFSISEGDLFS